MFVSGVLIAVLAVTAALPAQAAETSITITQSGSTNTGRYSIEIAEDGSSRYSGGGEVKTGTLPENLTQKLFADVQAAMPLSKMPLIYCAKSVSFGTATTVAYNGEQSPDISCPGNAMGLAIYKDAQEVKNALGVVAPPRRGIVRPVMPLPQQ